MTQAVTETKLLDQFRELAKKLQADRRAKQAEIIEIDKALASVATVVAPATAAPAAPATVAPAPVAPAIKPKRAYTRKAKKNGEPANRSRGRNGGLSGTQKIEAILSKAPKHEMASGDLAREAEKQGVKNPHSSYQSLKRRGRIELDNGTIRLVDGK